MKEKSERLRRRVGGAHGSPGTGIGGARMGRRRGKPHAPGGWTIRASGAAAFALLLLSSTGTAPLSSNPAKPSVGPVAAGVSASPVDTRPADTAAARSDGREGAARTAHGEARRAAVGVQEAGVVGQLTGPGSVNDTTPWDVHGTDLGHMFWHGDRLYMVFGDTFGHGGLGGRNWRSNALALLADPEPERGVLEIERMITGPDGAAKELIPSLKREGTELTVIPTHGISVGERMVLHYMSVTRWHGETGRWDVRHSGFAYSDDDGKNWTAPERAIRPGGTGFEQVAFVRGEEHVYILGIPEGRFGGVRLSRAAPAELVEWRSHEYWDGRRWTREAERAVEVVPAPVGELSVAWNDARRTWMMMYLNLERGAVVLRTAPELTGPWSEEEVVLTARDYPGLYSPYIVPLSHIGDEVYFTLSLWGPYNVFLARMELSELPGDATTVASDDEVR